MNVRDLLYTGNLQALEQLLLSQPSLANSEISLSDGGDTAVPLHRIADGISEKRYSGEAGVAIARLFLQHGANLNPPLKDGKDSPLTAACSLGCDQLALLYIQAGANIQHRGCHGGTALHWAAWCGRDVIVQQLVGKVADINELCTDFKSTPLFWAIHGHWSAGPSGKDHQYECARLLLEHGADASIPNFEGYRPVQLLSDHETQFLKLFR